MTAALKLYHLMRADLLERIRRYNVLVIIALTLYVTYLYLPPIDSGYLTFSMGGYRGVYNSAWVGSSVTVLCVILMVLPGFYLVKNAIERDRRTGVGQIIATTPLSRAQYTVGKMLSNLAFLAAMAGIATAAGIGMQLLRGEVMRVELGHYLLPYLLSTLPMMALVAALAVLFESIPWLRGGLGNVVFFFLYIAALTIMGVMLGAAMPAIVGGQAAYSAPTEPTGTLAILQSMLAACKAQNPGFRGGLVIGMTTVDSVGGAQTFAWEGVRWTASLILGRLLWIGVALVLALVSAVFFDRFDVAVERRKRRGEAEAQQAEVEPEPAAPAAPVRLGRLEGPARAGAVQLLARSVASELRLLLKGLPWWWYAVAAGLLVAGFLAPPAQVRGIWLPLAWIWPLMVWSSLGGRELWHHTQQIVFTAPHPLRRQLPATWMAGIGAMRPPTSSTSRPAPCATPTRP